MEHILKVKQGEKKDWNGICMPDRSCTFLVSLFLDLVKFLWLGMGIKKLHFYLIIVRLKKKHFLYIVVLLNSFDSANRFLFKMLSLILCVYQLQAKRDGFCLQTFSLKREEWDLGDCWAPTSLCLDPNWERCQHWC